MNAVNMLVLFAIIVCAFIGVYMMAYIICITICDWWYSRKNGGHDNDKTNT